MIDINLSNIEAERIAKVIDRTWWGLINTDRQEQIALLNLSTQIKEKLMEGGS